MKKQSRKLKDNIENLLPGVRKNVLLKRYTTFRVGGPAKYFFKAKTDQDLTKAVIVARKSRIPFFIIGHGSNVLFPDTGFRGLVVKVENDHYKIRENKIYAGAGMLMDTLVRTSINKGLRGLEWAGGLPGTLGGAVRGNAGAFGGETKDSIFEVEFLDNENKIKKVNNKNCFFNYRSSIFKKRNFIILSAVIKLSKGNKKDLWKIARNHIQYRKDYHPLTHPNAGSIFKNYDIKKASKEIKNLFTNVIKTDPFPIIPTALIILKAGLSGKTIGRAQISKKHSNYIINLGGATANDVKKLIKFAKNAIKNKFKINIETEIQIID
ncbi:MAG: UDP-N-acetylenolpyruvoylglucosamine reductase [Parcubacteria group bacterium GW2011_GWC1_38_6]|nr:MAG: UDP-N-acetylenolpyruvoylglucosamine reductase [Parcubacteria group bacterium GW2011_GWC1_38_6]